MSQETALKRVRSGSLSRSSSPKEEVNQTTWLLPPDESYSVMNFVLQNAACTAINASSLVIQLLEQLPKSSAAWGSDSKRWRQCFMPGVNVRVHWKGTDFEMQRTTARNESCATEGEGGLSRILKPDCVEGLRVSSQACTWKTLNALIRAADEFSDKCSSNGIRQTVVLPGDDGETVVQNVAPTISLKDVWWPDVAAKKRALASLKGMKPNAAASSALSARFVLGLRGMPGTGKGTLLRALATETKKELYQHTVTSEFTAGDFAELVDTAGVSEGETILVLREAHKLRPKTFDVPTARRVLNGLLTPLNLIVVFLFESRSVCAVEAGISQDFTHTMVSDPVVKQEHKLALAANVMKRLRVANPSKAINSAICDTRDTPIPSGRLINAVVCALASESDEECASAMKHALETSIKHESANDNPLVY